MENKNNNSKILVQSLSYCYDNGSVLNDITFEIKEGEVVAIIGPSGCGKTTLLNLLLGYLNPTSGFVKIDGQIRAVHQHGSLFPWLTVSENLTVGVRDFQDQKVKKDKVEEMIQLINLKGFDDFYPHELSGGMKQRVELGRVLIGNSDVILMDEPFSSLDYQTRRKMRKELLDLLAEKSKTVVIVTHDIEEAVQIADRVLVLSKCPTSICEEIKITIPKPRFNSSIALVDIHNDILSYLKN